MKPLPSALFVAVLTAAAIGMTGCSSPKDEPLPVIVPAPEAKPMTGLVQSGSRWEVPGLKHGPTWYTWSPDRRWISFNLESGLWAVSPDGKSEHHLSKGDAWRELAGWWQGGLVYLEHRKGDVVVGLARPGQESVEIATLPLKRTPENLFISRYAIYGDHLALFPGERAPLRVHLQTGAIEELGTVPTPARCVVPAPSPDGRYILLKTRCEEDRVRIVDLWTWTLQEAGEARFAAWSPKGSQWAALTGTGLDLGAAPGQVTHLTPPEPLKLIAGPFWSEDGARLAVVAEAKPATDSRNRDAVTEVWIVTPATGVWRKLATMQFDHVQGWHPSGEYLVVYKIAGSAAPPSIGMLDAGTGATRWLSLPPMEQRDATRVDERLLVVDGAATRPAQVPLMDALQVQPPYVSWIDYRPGTPSPALVVELRP